MWAQYLQAHWQTFLQDNGWPEVSETMMEAVVAAATMAVVEAVGVAAAAAVRR